MKFSDPVIFDQSGFQWNVGLLTKKTTNFWSDDDDAVDHVDVKIRLGYCSDTDHDYLKM